MALLSSARYQRERCLPNSAEEGEETHEEASEASTPREEPEAAAAAAEEATIPMTGGTTKGWLSIKLQRNSSQNVVRPTIAKVAHEHVYTI